MPEMMTSSRRSRPCGGRAELPVRFDLAGVVSRKDLDKAVAHKLARACYHMLKLQQPFCVQRCFA